MKNNRGNNSWPLVSIVIINARGTSLLERCLKTVTKTKYPKFEIIVVDCLSNGIEKWIGENHPGVKVLHFDQDIGPSASHNVSLQLAKGVYLAFLDNDALVDPDWLSELVKVLESDPSIGVVQSKILNYNDRPHSIDSAGDFIDYYGNGYRLGLGEKDRGQYDRKRSIFSARGAAMAVRRRVFEEVFMFDEDFFVYLDDTDFGWRVRLRGYETVLVPRSIVYHASGSTIRKRATFVTFHNSKNKIAMLIKNYNTCNLVRYILPCLMVTMGLSFLWLFKGENNVAISYVKAAVWNLLHLKKTWRKRLRIQSYLRKKSDSDVKSLMLRTNISTLSRLLFYGLQYDYEAAIKYASKQLAYGKKGIEYRSSHARIRHHYDKLYTEGYAENLKEYNLTRLHVFSKVMRESPQIVSKKLVLDFGCGTGLYIPLLLSTGATIMGIDISRKAIKMAHERFRRTSTFFLVADGSNLPFRESCFDVLFVSEVLEHVINPFKVVAETSRVLREEGEILGSVLGANRLSIDWIITYILGGPRYSRCGLPNFWPDYLGNIHLHHFPSQILKRVFSEAGIRIYKILYYDHFFHHINLFLRHVLHMKCESLQNIEIADFKLFRFFPNTGGQFFFGKKLNSLGNKHFSD